MRFFRAVPLRRTANRLRIKPRTSRSSPLGTQTSGSVQQESGRVLWHRACRSCCDRPSSAWPPAHAQDAARARALDGIQLDYLVATGASTFGHADEPCRGVYGQANAQRAENSVYGNKRRVFGLVFEIAATENYRTVCGQIKAELPYRPVRNQTLRRSFHGHT
jgi:hypothetical protein